MVYDTDAWVNTFFARERDDHFNHQLKQYLNADGVTGVVGAPVPEALQSWIDGWDETTNNVGRMGPIAFNPLGISTADASELAPQDYYYAQVSTTENENGRYCSE